MPQGPIRILDLRDSPWVDGPGRTILQTASMVDRDRCEILIGAFCGDGHGEQAYMQEAKRLGLQVFPIVERNTFDRQVLMQIRNAIQCESIDILHTHDFRSNIFGLLCAKRAGIPVVSTCHGWIANNWKGRVYTSIDKLTLRLFDCVVAVSDAMGKQLQGFGIHADRIQVIRNALIIEQYQPDRGNQEFRREFGISDDTHLIANIGRLSPEKGQDIFLRAARVILEDRQDVLFILIGVGPEETMLRRLAKELCIENFLLFAGYRKDMREIFNSLDLVVQSSFTEGMPNVILESMLMQVPVVATRVGGTAEVVRQDYSGVLIEPNNLDELVDGITRYLQNPGEHRAMAKNGCVFVREHFDHNRRISMMMETYESIIQGRIGR